MPLLKGKSEKAFKHNIKTEYEEGKPLKQSLAIAYAMKRKKKKMAEGGMMHPEDCDCPSCCTALGQDPSPGVAMNSAAMSEDSKGFNQKPVGDHDSLKDDLVDRIMKKMSPDYSSEARLSEGGMVANDTGNGQSADEMPNQFDDLVLDDDLESHYTGANSGDELGNDQEDEDREDIVSRIMKSNRKKDRNPRPA